VYYYPGFQSSVHGDKLRHELARDLTRETAWEAVMRIRCGKGLIVYDNIFVFATCYVNIC
jgi:protein transport protein SEC24